ncbi:MAG: Gfo/Idh/MocA family oxidoreductase [Gemmatimonadaceae bacterium]
MTTLSVALIGYGLGGANFHAPFIASTPGLRLATVMTSDPTRRAMVSERYPDARLAGDVRELLATKPDVVAISTPNATHVPLAKAMLEAGAHVVVDKPFAARAAEARELGRVASAVGRLAIPFQNRRWDGDYLTLRQLLADDRLGEVYRFESRFDRWRPVRKASWTRAGAESSAENIVHDLGTHLIDQALQLFGPVSRVYAELRRVDASVVTSDDMFLSLTHASGVVSHLGSTMSAGLPGPRYQVFGRKGAYVKHGVDPQEMQLRGGMRPGAPGYGEEAASEFGRFGAGDVSVVVPTLRGDYARFYEGVARAITDGVAAPVLVEEVAAGLDVIEAAFESVRTGTVVQLLRPGQVGPQHDSP